MKFLTILILAVVAIGCGADTSVSRQPSAAEIQAGIDRRIADVDKMNIPEAGKERMRAQIRGGQPQQTRK